MADDELKSALEIAMEKLDAEPDQQIQPLSEEQKNEIAEIRRLYKSRLAEREIGMQTDIRAALLRDPQKAAELQERRRQEKATLENEMEEKIAQVRNPS